MVHPRFSALLFLPLLLLSLLDGCDTPPQGASGTQPSQDPVPTAPERSSPSGTWKAEIRVKLGGCTSCADCRTGIRQISQIQSGSDHVEFKDGVARIVYPTPAPIRLLEVPLALSHSDLLKTHVDGVELEVAGQAEERDGSRFFVTSQTGQSWPMSAGKFDLPLGRTVVIVAWVDGWRKEPHVASLRVQRVVY